MRVSQALPAWSWRQSVGLVLVITALEAVVILGVIAMATAARADEVVESTWTHVPSVGEVLAGWSAFVVSAAVAAACWTAGRTRGWWDR